MRKRERRQSPDTRTHAIRRGNTHVTGAHAKIKLATRHRICDISSRARSIGLKSAATAIYRSDSFPSSVSSSRPLRVIKYLRRISQKYLPPRISNAMVTVPMADCKNPENGQRSQAKIRAAFSVTRKCTFLSLSVLNSLCYPGHKAPCIRYA